MLRRPSKQRVQTENELLRVRARAAMSAQRGFYNVQPTSFLLGILGAIAAVLFTLYCLYDEPSSARAPGTPRAGEIWVELE